MAGKQERSERKGERGKEEKKMEGGREEGFVLIVERSRSTWQVKDGHGSMRNLLTKCLL